jgi:hypothetical protein
MNESSRLIHSLPSKLCTIVIECSYMVNIILETDSPGMFCHSCSAGSFTRAAMEVESTSSVEADGSEVEEQLLLLLLWT